MVVACGSGRKSVAISVEVGYMLVVLTSVVLESEPQRFAIAVKLQGATSVASEKVRPAPHELQAPKYRLEDRPHLLLARTRGAIRTPRVGVLNLVQACTPFVAFGATPQ